MPSRTVRSCPGIPGVVQIGTGLYSYTSGKVATEENSLYRYTRVGQLPSRAVHGCTFIPGVGQLPSRTVQCCTGIPGIPGVGQQPSRTVEVYQG